MFLQMWPVRCLMVIQFSLYMECFANVSCTYSDVLYVCTYLCMYVCNMFVSRRHIFRNCAFVTRTYNTCNHNLIGITK